MQGFPQRSVIYNKIIEYEAIRKKTVIHFYTIDDSLARISSEGCGRGLFY